MRFATNFTTEEFEFRKRVFREEIRFWLRTYHKDRRSIREEAACEMPFYVRYLEALIDEASLN